MIYHYDFAMTEILWFLTKIRLQHGPRWS